MLVRKANTLVDSVGRVFPHLISFEIPKFSVEPSSLPGFEGCGVGADLDRAAKREHKSIVRTRDLLIDRSVLFQSDFRDCNRHMIPRFGTKGTRSAAVNPHL